MNDEHKNWFDPKINFAFLFALLLQGITAFIWVGAAAQRLDSLENRLNAQSPLSERLARLEAEVAGARKSLDRIENRLDKGGNHGPL